MADLKTAFDAYCNAEKKPDKMTTKALTKMCKDAGAYNKKVTTTDTDILHGKFKSKTTNQLDFAGFQNVCAELDKKCAGTTAKLAAANPDYSKGTTKTSKTGGVDKMTDTSQYTGSHKERFDESGKGKGIDGRADRADGSGYVGNYKGEGTYDKKH